MFRGKITKNPTEPLELSEAFFLPFEEEAKQLLIHCLFYCHVPLKEYSNRLLSLHEKTLFFLMTEKVVFLSGFYGLLLFKKNLTEELERISEELFEVWSVVVFVVVLVSSSTMFLISALVPISIFFTEQ